MCSLRATDNSGGGRLSELLDAQASTPTPREKRPAKAASPAVRVGLHVLRRSACLCAEGQLVCCRLWA